MKKYLLIGSILATSFFSSSVAWGANEVIGVNSAVKGKVTIAGEGATARDAVVKDNVRLGEEVNSRSESTLQVLLNDETVFTVGPDCVLTVDKFVYDPSKAGNSLTANVKKGMFRFMSGNISKSADKSVAIDTPVASMGVRGTIVEGLVGKDAIDLGRKMGVIPEGAEVDPNASLFILRGPGPNNRSKNRNGEIDVTSGGKTVVVKRSGYAALVLAEGAEPIGPFAIPDDIFEVFSNQLRTKPKENLALGPDPIEIEFFDTLSDLDWPEKEHHDCQITPIDPNDYRGDSDYNFNTGDTIVDLDGYC